MKHKWFRRLLLILVSLILMTLIFMMGIVVYRGTLSNQRPTNELPTVEYHDGATAKCKDGYYSYSTRRSGTCSKHGGVQTWFVEPDGTPTTDNPSAQTQSPVIITNPPANNTTTVVNPAQQENTDDTPEESCILKLGIIKLCS